MLKSILISTSDIPMLVILAVIVVALIVMFVLSSKRRKKQEEEAKNLIDSVKPGNKVKTIGGICGIVVEVDNEENTFVLETGTEVSGKCFIKFDKQAIYQTDAVVEKNEKKEETDKTEEVKDTAEEPFEETKTALTEEKKEEVKEEKTEDKK